MLAGRGVTVRVVSRHQPADLADAIEWRPADAADPEAASDGAAGTPLAPAVAATVAWYRTRPGTP
jgi:hypothetical protein